MEKMSFKEFISQCDVSHWEIVNDIPRLEYQKGKHVIMRVIPADDCEFEVLDKGDFKEVANDPEVRAVVRWYGEPVALTDSPYQEAYATYKQIRENYFKALPELSPTLEEAIEALS